jgi:CheY-like chemotaxis protein
MPEGGRLFLRTARVEVGADPAVGGEPIPAGAYVVLSVVDTGVGMSPESLSHLFEPFYTTRPCGKGAGLGLSTSHGIVKQSRGHIQVSSRPGEGTRVDVYLPEELERAPTRAVEPGVPGAPGASGASGEGQTILLLEDDAPLREFTGRALRRLGYQVLDAGSADEGLALEREHQGRIDLLLSDVVLPGRSGQEVARELRQRRPSLGVLFDVVGSSPEALVKVTDGRAMMHPIAGTRWRGETPEEDAALAADLLADPKERAEHLMLVDLGRNDLGRVCAPGSVEVVDFMSVERYSHVMHIVSTVVGRVDTGRTAFDVLAACFPAGTLSGAPKPRAMEIIDELEPTRRGVYGGCVGYLDFAGDADTAIAIRTAYLRDGVAHVQAGAGIVADSDPAAEDQECLNKAQAVLRAIATASTLRPAT